MDFKTVLLLISAIVMGFVIFTEAGCTQSKTCDDDRNSDSWRSVTLEYANGQENPLEATNKGTAFVSKGGEKMTIESFKGESLPSELNLWIKGLLEEHTALRIEDYDYLKLDADTRWAACMEAEAKLLIVRSSSRQPVAFVHYRFEVDPGSQHETLFISDLLVEKSMSTHGIHHHIINTLTEIASCSHMRKITVTIFHNDKATTAQYKSCGFTMESQGKNYHNFDVYSKIAPIQDQELD